MADTTAPNEKGLTPIRFHFHKLNFTPYSSAKNETSESIVRQIVTFLSQEQQANRGILIDRHESRGKETARPLFVTSTVIMLQKKRIRCSIALLRTGKIPLLKPADKFKLIPLDANTGEIAEQTHFFIDYSGNSVTVCVEFNYNGPRVSDIEYYFRIVARDKLRIAKATELELYMDSPIDKTLADLKNVLNFEVKVQPQKLAQLDTALVGQYFTGITNLASNVKPKFVKLEAMFQTPGKQVVSAELNKGANTMVNSFLNAFKAKPTNIDVFEHFVVKYEDKDGREEVFNLLAGKKELLKMIDLKKIKTREWYELIEADFDEFVSNL